MISTEKQRLLHWYATPQGQGFARNLQFAVFPWLEATFGYHAVQLGPLPMREILLDGLRINHRLLADVSDEADLQCDPEALPFAADSIDLLILAHTLEYVGDPHLLLREADRVLVPEGKVLVVGIDSWTLWGGYQKLRKTPFNAYSQGRVKDWLNVLGFEVQYSELLSMFNPQLPQWLQHSPKTARLANLLAANIAGGYVLLAKKRVATLTPIEPRWKTKPKLIASGLAEPAARGIKHVRKD